MKNQLQRKFLYDLHIIQENPVNKSSFYLNIPEKVLTYFESYFLN